jgi:hypothetical protein
MAQRKLPHGTARGGSRIGGKLVVLRPVDPVVRQSDRRTVVKQSDLEEMILLTRERREAEQRWIAKRETIVSALRDGATVEMGVHTAALDIQLEVR